MTQARNLTPFFLAIFFAVMALALAGAHAWSHEQAAQAAQTAAADMDISADDQAPVIDAVVEKTTV